MARGSEYVSVRIVGLNEVVRDLIALGVEVDDVKDAMSDIARIGAGYAARFAPRLSGRLAGDVRGNRAKSKAVVTAGRASVPYAGPINYGWAAHGIEPSGFMQKADDAVQPIAIRRLDFHIDAAIRKRGLS